MPGAVEVNGTAQKAAKISKNALRRAKKKADKKTTSEATSHTTSVIASELDTPDTSTNGLRESNKSQIEENDETARISGDATQKDAMPNHEFDLPEDDPLYAQYQEILARFNDSGKDDSSLQEPEKPDIFYDDDNDDIPEEDEDSMEKLSKKKRKQMNKLSVAELKAIVRKPELVDWTDTSAPDPRLLVSIKGQRNVVPVPGHWALKREYLSSKRGIEKQSFALPQFIKDTGISDMRDAVLEKQAEQSLKQKQRERVQPKMGKLDIDYQKLYEAFFRHQTKPELTRYGEVYYEGKEYETNLRHLRPGELSDGLREALGMPPGVPPPWLLNQQRIGPPPSYPALKIQGLNAPIPPGAQWGMEPGQWGKPPLDQYQRPLYGGDIFGMGDVQPDGPTGEPVEKTLWGELQPPEEESEDEAEEEEEEEEDEDAASDTDMAGAETPSGTFTPGGMASAVPTEIGGVESVSEFNLRKQRPGTTTEEPSGPPRQAYQVLAEQNIRSSGFFGGERAYDLSKANGQHHPVLGEESKSRKRKVGDLDVSVDVDALERDDRLSREEVARLHESGRRNEGRQWGGAGDQDDLSAMIAEESAKRLKTEKENMERRRQGKR